MELIDIVLLLLVAGICGGIGQAIAGSERGGVLTTIALGFIGAIVGRWLATELRLPELFNLHIAGSTIPVVWTIIGSSLFVAVIVAVTGRR